MLTRDLLRYHVQRGNVRPRFIDPEDEALRQLAEKLVVLATTLQGAPRCELVEALNEAGVTLAAPLIARGLIKLVVDRCVFAEPDETAPARRLKIFTAATLALRNLASDAPFAEYAAILRQTAGEADLYSDLPANRPLLHFKTCTPLQLLQRYNMAQAQGLVLACRKLVVTTRSHDVLRVRRVLRWLKFCRLVADISHTGATWQFAITGPAAILILAKKYGLQLANFLPVVAVLDNYTLEAEVIWQREQVWHLTLTQDDPLVSPYLARLGYVPKEVEHVAQSFTDAEWQLDLAVEPRHVGPTGIMLPDFTFKHQTAGPVHVELFHRWHHHSLRQRLCELASRPDPQVVLGVDRALAADTDLQTLLKASPQVLIFSGFPTVRRLRAYLSLHQAAQSS